MKTAHTPGAMRAATEIVALNETTRFSPGTRARLAEIIDRETGAKEMLEALEAMFDSFCVDQNSEATKCMECGYSIGTCDVCETCRITLKARAAINKARSNK